MACIHLDLPLGVMSVPKSYEPNMSALWPGNQLIVYYKTLTHVAGHTGDRTDY